MELNGAALGIGGLALCGCGLIASESTPWLEPGGGVVLSSDAALDATPPRDAPSETLPGGPPMKCAPIDHGCDPTVPKGARKIAPPPFGSRFAGDEFFPENAGAAWNGRELFVSRHNTAECSSRCTLLEGAAYDPVHDTWRTLDPPLPSFPYFSQSVIGTAQGFLLQRNDSDSGDCSMVEWRDGEGWRAVSCPSVPGVKLNPWVFTTWSRPTREVLSLAMTLDEPDETLVVFALDNSSASWLPRARTMSKPADGPRGWVRDRLVFDGHVYCRFSG